MSGRPSFLGSLLKLSSRDSIKKISNVNLSGLASELVGDFKKSLLGEKADVNGVVERFGSYHVRTDIPYHLLLLKNDKQVYKILDGDTYDCDYPIGLTCVGDHIKMVVNDRNVVLTESFVNETLNARLQQHN